MVIETLGDSAYILRDLPCPAFQVAAHLSSANLPGLIEATASYDTVGLYVDFEFDPSSLPKSFPSASFEQISHKIPVCYFLGDDLAEVAAYLKLAAEEVVAAHSSTTYECAAIGFCPGFPYLQTLPERISGVPRRLSPRPRMPVGSVAITGDQTGVYPLPRPGGWSIIGRTPLSIVDLVDEYFPIKAGDLITFYPISEEEFRELEGLRL